MRPNSTRMWLLSLSQRPEAAQLLDVGITNNLRKGLEVPIAPFMTLQEHARYKYLISADGFTASCRGSPGLKRLRWPSPGSASQPANDLS
ncbi:CAP10 domain-containing protein, partial [Haematococcus lacustris]